MHLQSLAATLLALRVILHPMTLGYTVFCGWTSFDGRTYLFPIPILVYIYICIYTYAYTYTFIHTVSFMYAAFNGVVTMNIEPLEAREVLCL